MKRIFGWLLALALVASFGTAFASEAAEEYLNVAHYGIVYHGNFTELDEEIAATLGPAPDDPARVIFVSSFTAPIGWVEIPADGQDAEMYIGKGVRFTLDESSFAENVNIARPTELEIAGEVQSGLIHALDSTQLELAPDDGGDMMTLAITGETYVDANLATGKTCEVIYDGDTALYIVEANG